MPRIWPDRLPIRCSRRLLAEQIRNWVNGMSVTDTPAYARFDDYRYSQQVAVLVRWFLLVGWLTLINTSQDLDTHLVILNGIGAVVAVVNGYLTWRICGQFLKWRWCRDDPVDQNLVVALSVIDLTAITTGLAIECGFDNRFFVLYYPALLGTALVLPSLLPGFALTVIVAVAYSLTSVFVDDGMDTSNSDQFALAMRIIAMFAVVAAAALMSKIELRRRQEAVADVESREQENRYLERQALEAELIAQEELHRLSREVHDGISQSVYALHLNLEAAAEVAKQYPGPLLESLNTLVPLARQTLQEARSGLRVLNGSNDIATVTAGQLSEFESVSRIKTSFEAVGKPECEVEIAATTAIYRIVQEALANAMKHSNASIVEVNLQFKPDFVHLTVKDDGVGFQGAVGASGFGLQNMRERAEELGGECRVAGRPEGGVIVELRLPLEKVST